LIPAVGGLSLLGLVDLRQDGDTLIDGTPCYSVAARYPKVATVELEFLIEKDALLIRRIVTTSKPAKLLATELRDSIRVNDPIDDTVFKYAAR
jgi:hypothetical protein